MAATTTPTQDTLIHATAVHPKAKAALYKGLAGADMKAMVAGDLAIPDGLNLRGIKREQKRRVHNGPIKRAQKAARLASGK